MKNLCDRRGLALLAVSGAVSAATALTFYYTSVNAGRALPGLMAFPFGWIGQGLRMLSLPGGIGNAAAWVLYLLVALSPAMAALALKKHGHGSKDDVLLAVCSGLLLPVLYGMVNPEKLSSWFSALLPATQAQAVCGAAIWVCLLSWGVLRVMRALPMCTVGQLMEHLDRVLSALCVLMIVRACGLELYGLLRELEAVKQANTALSASQLMPTQLFLGLYYVVETLPSLLMVGVMRQGQRLLAAAKANRYSKEAVDAAHKLTSVCQRVITISVMALLGYALAQLAFAPRLYNLEANITLPLIEIAMLLGTLVLAHWTAEGKALKEENEGFI